MSRNLHGGRARKTCTSLGVDPPCQACSQPQKKLKCLSTDVSRLCREQRWSAENISELALPSLLADAEIEEAQENPVAADQPFSLPPDLRPWWKPADTGRPATTCRRLGVAIMCASCKNPEAKQRCQLGLRGSSSDEQRCNINMFKPYQAARYEPKDFRTEKHCLLEKPLRKGRQDARSLELRSARDAREKRLRDEGYNAALELSSSQKDELEALVAAMQDKMMAQTAELLKARRDRSVLMGARRQLTLSSMLAKPDEERPELHLSTRSAFNLQAVKQMHQPGTLHPSCNGPFGAT